jgi:hypothetical protein
MAFLTDPDGNALMLHHRYAPGHPTRERRLHPRAASGYSDVST